MASGFLDSLLQRMMSQAEENISMNASTSTSGQSVKVIPFTGRSGRLSAGGGASAGGLLPRGPNPGGGGTECP